MMVHSRAIQAVGLSAVALIAANPAQDALADVVAQWHFDELPGETVAADSIGVHDGALAGSATFVPGGISGNAISVTRDGNGYVNMGDAFPFDQGDFSIVAWVQTAPNDQSPDYLFLARHRATIVAGYILGINANGAYGATDKVWFYQSVNPGGELISSAPVNDGQWHQVVVSYHALDVVDLYVDGTPIDNSRPASPIVFIDTPFLVGGLDWGGTPVGTFDGLVDEVQMYDHALGPCEVLHLYLNPEEIAPEINTCPADINDDAVVNVDDLFEVLTVWGQADVPADVNCDRIVNINDLFELLGDWGPCP